MRRGLQWYKREPRAFLDAIMAARMTARQAVVYTIILDLIYDHGGETPDDPKHVASYLSDIGAAAVRNSIEDLVAMGKLSRCGGMLIHKRAENEAKSQRKLSENRAEIGRLGGVSSGFSRSKSHDNNTLTEANASNEPKAEIEIDRDESVGIEVLRPSIPKKEEEAREQDLVLEVMKAVGVDVDHPSTYWRGPAVEEHVALWADLGLTDIEIVETAKSSRQVHPDAPDGPRALDRFMEAAASAKRGVATTRKRAEKAPSPTPPTEDQAKAYALSTAAWIKRGTCPASMLRPDKARAMLKDGLVTEDDLRKCGIAW